MRRQRIELDDNDEIMRRCRQVRDDLNRRYNTVDKMWAYLMSLEKEASGKRTAKRTVCRAASRRPSSSAACRVATRAR
jgi:hypothetical protein